MANARGTTSAFLDDLGLLTTDDLSLLAKGTSSASARLMPPTVV